MLSKEFVCLFVLGFGVGLLMLGICLYFGCCMYVVVIFTPFFLCQPVPSSGLFVFFYTCVLFWGNLDKFQCFFFNFLDHLILLISQVCFFLFFSLKGSYLNIPASIKGQLISKGLFAILKFFQKTNQTI